MHKGIWQNTLKPQEYCGGQALGYMVRIRCILIYSDSKSCYFKINWTLQLNRNYIVLTENDYSANTSDSESSDSSDEEIITFTQIRIPHTIQQTTGVENQAASPYPQHHQQQLLRGLPAYQLYDDTQPPSYDTIQPKTSTCTMCQNQFHHSNSDDSLQGTQAVSKSQRRFIWTVLNLTFLSPMLCALATIILYISQLAFQEGGKHSDAAVTSLSTVFLHILCCILQLQNIHWYIKRKKLP